MSQRFQKNIERWAQICPKQAWMLPYYDGSYLHHSTTKENEPNLENIQNGLTYHENGSAAKEAALWFAQLPLSDTHLLCVYGVGCGHYYEAARSWLKKNRKHRLVFLEDDLGVIQKLLETKQGSKILRDCQVQLLFFSDIQAQSSIFSTLPWDLKMKNVVVTGLKAYLKMKPEVFDTVSHKLKYDASITTVALEEYLKFGAHFYRNFYQNILYLPDSYLGNHLFGKFKKIPAIICGAGPSLSKHLKMLRGLRDKAIIFAGGSALNALQAAGIDPHFGAGIDPNLCQLTRLQSTRSEHLPFFYRNRMFHEAFKAIKGPRLYITGSGGYNTSEFFEDKFHLESEFIDEGHNVVNLCVEIAFRLGCDPIIFIGLDLSYTGMKLYAPGVIEEEKFDIAQEPEKPMIRNDIYGKPTYTVWKWIAESKWTSDFAKNHPDVKMINCTEGGIGFDEIENLPFTQAIDKYVTKKHKLENRIHDEIKNSLLPQVTKKKIISSMKELKKSLQNCIGLLSLLIQEAKEMMTRLKAGSGDCSVTGSAALAEMDLVEEAGYKYVLSIFNDVYSCMQSADAREIRLRQKSESARMVKKLKLNRLKYKYLQDVAKANIVLIDFALKNQSLSS